jgi:hypothetical protein
MLRKQERQAIKKIRQNEENRDNYFSNRNLLCTI